MNRTVDEKQISTRMREKHVIWNVFPVSLQNFSVGFYNFLLLLFLLRQKRLVCICTHLDLLVVEKCPYKNLRLTDRDKFLLKNIRRLETNRKSILYLFIKCV